MTKSQINIRMDDDLLERLDDWRSAQPVAPSRTATVEAALTAWLDEREDTATCAYCGVEVADCFNEPADPYDDEAWSLRADVHRPGCEWVETRAHWRTEAAEDDE